MISKLLALAIKLESKRIELGRESEQNKEPEQENTTEAVGPGPSEESVADISQDIDEYELVDPGSPLEKSEFWDGMKVAKWSERKDAVAELTKLVSTKRIAPAGFTEVCRTLKKLSEYGQWQLHSTTLTQEAKRVFRYSKLPHWVNFLFRNYMKIKYQASKDDITVYVAISSVPSSEYTNVSRWYFHIDALLRISGVSGDGKGVIVEGFASVAEEAPEAPATNDAKADAEEDDDDDVDLFGEETEEKQAAEARAASVKASGKKKESKFLSFILKAGSRFVFRLFVSSIYQM
ncbi:hypothetical protein GIB67_014187 [Kingdonia uniflora]|uniref:Uncharacterized protein n=1 Tax=Kingdonia uniflora TaxID=39325 RepID=A0A7J7M1R9_9MAGN|nr:hypothetical protein GIB67_014187 [Kingdonia uniflora]